MRKIVIASDHVGFSLKQPVCAYLRGLGLEVADIGADQAEVPVDYPDYAQKAARLVVAGEYDDGIVICGTGIGVSIAANKVPGARAALCFDAYTAHQARAHNDANILALGSWVITPQRAETILDEWLKTPFEYGRHVPRLAQLDVPFEPTLQPLPHPAADRLQFSVAISLRPTSFGPVLFAGQWREGLRCAAEDGFQAVELSVRNPEDVPVTELKQLLQTLGLNVSAFATGQGCVHDGLCLSAPDPDLRRRAIQRMEAIAGLAAEFGATLIIGGVRGRIGGQGQVHQEQLDRTVEAIAACVQAAARCQVRPVIELINRYETDLFNRVDQGLDLLAQLGEPQASLLLDTFHMNIEEADLPAAIRKAGSRLGYVHIADSNRQAPGQGHIDFPAIFCALAEIDYRGAVSAEVLPLPDDLSALQRTRAYLETLLEMEPA